VTAARHRLVVEHRLRRRLTRLVLPTLAATAVTATVVGVALAADGAADGGGQSAQVALATPQHTVHASADYGYLANRARPASRSAKRVTLQEKPDVAGHRYLTAPLNVWPQPREAGSPLTVLDPGSRVAVTGMVRDGWAEILREGDVRWVNADYLVKQEPQPAAGQTASGDETASGSTAGPVLSGAPCPSGSSVESGIVSDAIALHRAVCAHFPQVTTYGGYRPDGEHSDGHAIDMMVYSDSGLGQAVADWVRANASALKVDDVIWAQHIWTTERASEGWRSMPDRGSVTANHYDHVHVRVF
jgi:hypothetical protein